MSNFQGQMAVVTGASSGIGRAIAIHLARHGAEVCLVARRREALESVAATIKASGGNGHVCCGDLTRDADISRLVGSIQQGFGNLQILVLCGGAIGYGPISEATIDQLDLQYRSNLRCYYMLVQALLPLLRMSRGQIVFVNSSVATRSSGGGNGQFTATQYGLRAIADSLREEVNRDGIRVLSVYPGRTATPRMVERFEHEGKVYNPERLMQPEDVATMVVYALSLPNTAEVTEIRMRPMMNWR